MKQEEKMQTIRITYETMANILLDKLNDLEQNMQFNYTHGMSEEQMQLVRHMFLREAKKYSTLSLPPHQRNFQDADEERDFPQSLEYCYGSSYNDDGLH